MEKKSSFAAQTGENDADEKTFVLSERYFLDLVGVLTASISGAMFCAFGLDSLPLDAFFFGAVLASLVGAAVFAAAARLNDYLIATEKGFRALALMACVGICAGSFLLLVNAFLRC